MNTGDRVRVVNFNGETAGTPVGETGKVLYRHDRDRKSRYLMIELPSGRWPLTEQELQRIR